MKDTHSLLTNLSLVEDIIISGKIDLLPDLYDQYYEDVYQYLFNYSKDAQVARMLSFYAMKRLFLQLPNYHANQSFLAFAINVSYQVCRDWIEKKEDLQSKRQQFVILENTSNQKAAIKKRVLGELKQIFWEKLSDYFEDQAPTTKLDQNQLPTAQVLHTQLGLAKNDYILLMMNVWSILSIQYPHDHQEDFIDLQVQPITMKHGTFRHSFQQLSLKWRQHNRDCTMFKDLRKGIQKVGKKIRDAEKVF